MQTLVIQHLCDPNPTHIIIECDDTDTCPGCGAGYKVGMSACEYCKRPVHMSMAEVVAPLVAFMCGEVQQ